MSLLTEIRTQSKKTWRSSRRDTKSPKIKGGVLGKDQRYRAGKLSIFWMKLVSLLGLIGLMPVHSVDKHTKKSILSGVPKSTAIGAISMNSALALMTMNDSMDGQAFAIFIQHFMSSIM
jgi:hypothetical protein